MHLHSKFALLPPAASCCPPQVFVVLLPIFLLLWCCMLAWLGAISCHHYVLLVSSAAFRKRGQGWDMRWQAPGLPPQPAEQQRAQAGLEQQREAQPIALQPVQPVEMQQLQHMQPAQDDTLTVLHPTQPVPQRRTQPSQLQGARPPGLEHAMDVQQVRESLSSLQHELPSPPQPKLSSPQQHALPPSPQHTLPSFLQCTRPLSPQRPLVVPELENLSGPLRGQQPAPEPASLTPPDCTPATHKHASLPHPELAPPPSIAVLKPQQRDGPPLQAAQQAGQLVCGSVTDGPPKEHGELGLCARASDCSPCAGRWADVAGDTTGDHQQHGGHGSSAIGCGLRTIGHGASQHGSSAISHGLRTSGHGASGHGSSAISRGLRTSGHGASQHGLSASGRGLSTSGYCTSGHGASGRGLGISEHCTSGHGLSVSERGLCISISADATGVPCVGTQQRDGRGLSTSAGSQRLQRDQADVQGSMCTHLNLLPWQKVGFCGCRAVSLYVCKQKAYKQQFHSTHLFPPGAVLSVQACKYGLLALLALAFFHHLCIACALALLHVPLHSYEYLVSMLHGPTLCYYSQCVTFTISHAPSHIASPF